MARVTVEDCIEKVPNRFELVLVAGHRSRMISAGAPITLERDNDKNPVVALREIAEETVSSDDLKEDFIHSMQKYVEVDEPETEAAPQIRSERDKVSVPVLGQDDQTTDKTIDTITEDELLRGLEGLAAGESGSRSRSRSR